MMHALFDDFLHLAEKIWLITRHQNLPVYDFEFSRYFKTRRPLSVPPGIEVVARIGAFSDYTEQEQILASLGMKLINTAAEHFRCSELQNWYTLLEDLTPKTLIFSGQPDVVQISDLLGWPIFMKGSRQTSRHKKSLAIVESPEHLGEVLKKYEQDDILHWQKIACRKFIPLRKVQDAKMEDRLPSSFEFRTFWWRQELVGFGRYWWEGDDYSPTAKERRDAIDISNEAARRVNVPFVVVDVAQALDGSWIVVECNDAQESGYAGVSPVALWQNILDRESLNPSGAA